MAALRCALAVWLLAALAGCASEPEFELPPPRYEEREQTLVEVREKLELLEDADAAQAAELLGHEDHRVRRAAAQRLGALGEDAAPRRREQDDGADAGEISEPDAGDAGAALAGAVEQLIERLKDEHPRVRCAAAIALSDIGDERALDPLVAALTDEDRFVRLWAWKALRRFGDAAIPVMLSHTSSKSPYRDLGYRDEARNRHTIRAPLRERLALLGKAVVPQLIEALDDGERDGWVRINAAIILGMVGADASESLPTMLENSQTTNNRLRLEIARSLGHIGDLHPDVVPTLEQMAKDRNRKISGAAKAALKEIDQAAKEKAKAEKKKKDREASRPKPKTGRPPAGEDDKSGRSIQTPPGAAADPSGIVLDEPQSLDGRVESSRKKIPRKKVPHEKVP